MRLLRGMFAAGLLVALAVPAGAAEVAEGNYKLSFFRGTTRTTYYLIGVKEKGGTPSAELVAVPPGLPRAQLGVKSFAVDGKKVKAVVQLGSNEATFTGMAKDKDTIRGSFAFGRSVYPAEMTATEQKELTARDRGSPLDVPALVKAAQLNLQPRLLRSQAARATDADEKAKLLKQAEEAAEKAQQELPKLYAEVLEKHADSPAVFAAVDGLVGGASARGVKPEQAARWAGMAAKAAEGYGEAFKRHTHLHLAGLLLNEKGMGQAALEHARAGQKLLGEDAPPAARAAALKILHKALADTGKGEEAATVKVALDKVEAILDAEYHKTVPPFKVAKFKGREGKSTRAVVMELFTGAQCPPCVAADVAFDALNKAYQPSELILIQYHMHIPGPDPLTNEASEARWAYYRAKFAGDVRGTPTTIFNGKPQAGGGGGMSRAEVKFDQYRGIIDPLLETEAEANVGVTAKREGDTIHIEAKVSDVKDGDARLRLVLVEENIRYVGGNNLRFHHQVVRDLPGGAEGIALKAGEEKYTATVDLTKVRAGLVKYLDNYAKTRAFPNPDRPLDLKGLRVIAFVQNDKTGAILNGAQADVEE